MALVAVELVTELDAISVTVASAHGGSGDSVVNFSSSSMVPCREANCE